MQIKPEALTAELLRQYAAVAAVYRGHAVELRPNRRLAPFVGEKTPSPVSPPDLEIDVLSLDEADLAPYRERINQIEVEMRAAKGART